MDSQFAATKLGCNQPRPVHTVSELNSSTSLAYTGLRAMKEQQLWQLSSKWTLEQRWQRDNASHRENHVNGSDREIAPLSYQENYQVP
jgi:hypothetical protein